MRVQFLLPLVAGAGLALLAAAPVTAQTPYPPTEAQLTVSATTVVVGDTVTVEGSGYQAGELILITVTTTPIAAAAVDAPQPERQLAMVPVARAVPVAAGPGAVASTYPKKRVRADENGSFTAKVRLTEVGRATITATGKSSGASASVVVTVLASADELPETGSDAWPLLRIGGTSVALGAMLLLASLAWRRYRPRATG